MKNSIYIALIFAFCFIACLQAAEETPFVELKGESTRHTVMVNFFPDGKKIITATADAFHIWDAESGEHLKEIKWDVNHKDGLDMVDSIVFSPDGKRFAVVGHIDRMALNARNAQGVVRIWEVETGKMVQELKGHTATVKSAVFASDNKRIVTASADKTARIWNVESGKELQQLGHQCMVTFAAFSPDGKEAITTTAGAMISAGDALIRIWDTDSGKEKKKIGHMSIDRAILSPDWKTYFAYRCINTDNGYTGYVSIYDTDSGMELQELDGSRSNAARAGLESVTFSPDGKKVAAANWSWHEGDFATRIWDVESGRTLHEWYEITPFISFSPDGKKFVMSGKDGNGKNVVQIWDLELLQKQRPAISDF